MIPGKYLCAAVLLVLSVSCVACSDDDEPVQSEPTMTGKWDVLYYEAVHGQLDLIEENGAISGMSVYGESLIFPVSGSCTEDGFVTFSGGYTMQYSWIGQTNEARTQMDGKWIVQNGEDTLTFSATKKQ